MELRCSFYIPSSFFLDKTDHPKPRGLCKRLRFVPFVFFSEPSLWCRLLVSVLCLSPRQLFCVFFRVYLFCLPPRCPSCNSSSRASGVLGGCGADTPARCRPFDLIEQAKCHSTPLWGLLACSMICMRDPRRQNGNSLVSLFFIYMVTPGG